MVEIVVYRLDVVGMVDVVRYIFVFDNGLMVGVVVVGQFIQNIFVFLGAFDGFGYGVGCFFWELIGVGKVILVFLFVNLGCFCEVG